MSLIMMTQQGLTKSIHLQAFQAIKIPKLMMDNKPVSLYIFMLIFKTVYNCKHMYNKKHVGRRPWSLKNLDMRDRALI